jgi:hypothetical protein
VNRVANEDAGRDRGRAILGMIANLFGSKERSDRAGVMEVHDSIAGSRVDKQCAG